MLETIRIVQPSFVIGENVAGLTSMDDGQTFDNILASLEDEGYTVESFILPACGVGAWHRRDRLWIVGYSKRVIRWEKSKRRMGMEQDALDRSGWQKNTNRHTASNGVLADTASEGLQDRRGTQMGESRKEQKPERPYCTSSDGTRSRSQKQQQRKRTQKEEPRIECHWQAEPGVDRMVSRLPNRVDRIKALGNSVVPQVVYEIYQAIEKTFLT